MVSAWMVPAWAESAAPPAGTDGAGQDSLVLCTAPWPPFTENVPPPQPPRPPATRPDPLALGFTPPGGTGPDDVPPDEQTDLATLEDSDTADVVPPLPPDAKGEGDIMTAQESPVGPSTATDIAGSGADLEPQGTDVFMLETDDETGTAMEDEGGDEPSIADLADDLAELDTSADDPAPASDTIDDGDIGDPLSRLHMPMARALLPQGNPGGPITEVVVAACDAAGLPCRINMLPWLKPEDVLASGRCDGVFPIEPTEETRPFMVPSQPLVESRLALFTLKTKLTKVSDFTDFIVLAHGPSDNAYRAHQLVEHLDQSRLVFGPDLPRLIARLGTLRPDDRVALFGNYHVITHAMAEVDDSVPALSVVPAGQQTLNVGFARNRVPGPVVKAFNQGLHRLRETRELQEILDGAGLDMPRDTSRATAPR